MVTLNRQVFYQPFFSNVRCHFYARLEIAKFIVPEKAILIPKKTKYFKVSTFLSCLVYDQVNVNVNISVIY